MLDQPQIVHTDVRRAAVIRFTIPRSEIGNAMGPGIGELMGTLASQGIAPAGPIFSHHLRMSPDMFDFELGVPVATPVAAAGRVQPGQLPAAKVARAVYRGPYEGLSAAWAELDAWVAAQGERTARGLWECYVAGPESGPDPAAWRTELNHSLRG